MAPDYSLLFLISLDDAWLLWLIPVIPNTHRSVDHYHVSAAEILELGSKDSYIWAVALTQFLPVILVIHKTAQRHRQRIKHNNKNDDRLFRLITKQHNHIATISTTRRTPTPTTRCVSHLTPRRGCKPRVAILVVPAIHRAAHTHKHTTMQQQQEEQRQHQQQ